MRTFYTSIIRLLMGIALLIPSQENAYCLSGLPIENRPHPSFERQAIVQQSWMHHPLPVLQEAIRRVRPESITAVPPDIELISTDSKEFSYRIGNRVIRYEDGVRIEISLSNGRTREWERTNPHRDYGAEEQELKHVFRLVGETISRWEAQSFIHFFTQLRNQSLPLWRKVLQERREKRMRAQIVRHVIASGSRVHIYVIDAKGQGRLGKAYLFARGILRDVPQADIHIYIVPYEKSYDRISFQKTVGGKIHLHDVSEEGMEEALAHSKIHISIGPEIDASIEGAKFSARMLSLNQNASLDSEMAVTASHDLSSPHGVLYLDRSLADLKHQKDTWNRNTFIARRTRWIENFLTKSQKRALLADSQKQTYKPTRAIWSWGYVQDARQLNAELRYLSTHLLHKPLHVVDTDPHLLLHLRLGNHLTTDLSITELQQWGYTVIGTDGTIFSPTKKGLPVTILMHSEIGHEELRELNAQLSGTLGRSHDDAFWIEFPCFVTGTASWLEAVSASSIYFHDLFDGHAGNLIEIQEQLGFRKHIFDQAPDPVAVDYLQQFISQLSLGMWHEEVYRDLEASTRRAREFSEFMYTYNMIDDVIEQMAIWHPSKIRIFRIMVMNQWNAFQKRFIRWLQTTIIPKQILKTQA